MLSPMHQLEILAPAKVNLYLGVLGKRTDGYHEIVSVMQKLDLTDRLLLSREGRGVTLHCPASPLPEDHDNLCWKAARAFFDRTGLPDTVRITLHKRIPVAAGLGGGSSDAAAVLLGLNRLCAAGLSEAALLTMAAPLGADVPFFVSGHHAALATGTGTELQPITEPTGYWLVLVNPGISVSTRWVYENLVLTSADNPYKLSGYSHRPEYAASLVAAGLCPGPDTPPLFNDLEAVTVARYPVIQSIKEQLLGHGATVALMSGSGPTVFGLFHQYDLAASSWARFQELYPEVFLVSPLH